jgi:hypothetical protein
VGKEVEYREYAEQVRTIAGQLKDSERAKLLEIAVEWDRLANDYERRSRRTALRIRSPKPKLQLGFHPLRLVVAIVVGLTSGMVVNAGWTKRLRALRRQDRNAPLT